MCGVAEFGMTRNGGHGVAQCCEPMTVMVRQLRQTKASCGGTGRSKPRQARQGAERVVRTGLAGQGLAGIATPLLTLSKPLRRGSTLVGPLLLAIVPPTAAQVMRPSHQ